MRQGYANLLLTLLFSFVFLHAKSQQPDNKKDTAPQLLQQKIDTSIQPLQNTIDTLYPRINYNGDSLIKPPKQKLDSLSFLRKSKTDTFPHPPAKERDTFFLAKKKGILGRIGKSISVDDPTGSVPIKIANPFLPFAGRVISSIEIVRLGFDRNIYDTNIIRHNVGLSIANALHRNTLAKVISNDLLFKTGEKLFPNLLADNERLLRDEVYLQDARILVKFVPGSTDSVDVIVITKDVFSIGGSAYISSATQGTFNLQEQNVGGHGNEVALNMLYDKKRNPQTGYGAEFTRRNINGSFIDWSTGFQTYSPAFNTGLKDVVTIYTGFQKPLVTAYIPWTGALNLVYNQTNNNYPGDSLYNTNHKYSNYDADGWFGYNFGSKRLLYKNLGTRLRKFIAIRAFNNHFTDVPAVIPFSQAFLYQNARGVLGSINVFMQNYYRTNFIYGFGRDEDVPEGFSSSIVGGWTDLDGRKRPYFGLNGELNKYSKKERYSDYTLGVGGYMYHNNLEDFNILFNVYHFTRLKKISENWFNRNFITANITKQVSDTLGQQLYLQSSYGLPYIGGPTQYGDLRASLQEESVFFNLKKFLGFRFAPFAFGDMSLLTPTNMGFSQSNIYTAWGGGIRTRNENLIFGTIELRSYYIPKTLPGIKGWRVEINSNLQFKFNSTFIKQPDFVMPN